ncbi:MAG TPA: transporter, partial [Xanthomonadales bacterium]|nr:transporter [Xanthomonadales bacterium]
MLKLSSRILLLLLLSLHVAGAWAQSLEPRRWTHLPIDTNFVGLGSGYSRGDILFDPALQIEDASMNLYFMGLTYIRSFGLLGKTARIEATLPYAMGKWEGLLRGDYASVRRHGFSDPSVRFSVNLLGSPALKGKEFAAYRAANPVRTLVGVAVDITAPWGEYRFDRLINLGGNRYIVRPQVGVLHQHNKWEFEATASVFFFGDNDEFFTGVEREQEPLWFIQGHAIYSFRPGVWAGFSSGYGYGGDNTIAGINKQDDGRV